MPSRDGIRMFSFIPGLSSAQLTSNLRRLSLATLPLCSVVLHSRWSTYAGLCFSLHLFSWRINEAGLILSECGQRKASRRARYHNSSKMPDLTR